MTLTNTTAGGTLNRGDVLTGFFFSVASADPSLALASGTGTAVKNGTAAIPGTDLNSGTVMAGVQTTGTAASGRFVLKGVPGGTLGTNINNVNFPYEYGVNTSGLSGIFPGSLVGSDDYAIVAAGTLLSTSGLSSIQLVQTSADFVITGFGLNTLNQIQSVTLAYGSLPTAMFGTIQAAPEPAALSLTGLGLLIGAVWIRRRPGTRR